MNGLQARLELVEKEKINGTRWLVTYLELRNVRDLGNQMEVNCDYRHLKVELVDANGSQLRDGWMLPRTGPTQELNVIVLPWDSSIPVTWNAGIGASKADAIVAVDSGAWVIQENEKGKVYLRATLTGENRIFLQQLERWSR